MNSWFFTSTFLLCGLIALPVRSQVQDGTKIALSGFSVSESFAIPDRQQLEIAEPNLQRLIYRLWQTSLSNLEAYSQYTQAVDWADLLKDPPGYRLQVFHRKGRIQSVTRVQLPGSDDTLEELPRHVVRARGVTDDGQPFEVVSLSCPRTWLAATDLNEPISFTGFFYATIASDPADESITPDIEPEVIPLFAAKQIFWHPNEINPALGISDSHVELARHGVDIAGLELVRQEDRKALGSRDARTFYQFLEAVETANPSNLKDSIDHMELLRQPTNMYGRHVRFRARVKMGSIVRPQPPTTGDVTVDPYYQLIVFPDLRDARNEPTTVELGKGDEKLTYRRFPFTVICRELPAGMSPKQIENQQVWIEGFYFRFWQYDAERTQSAGVGAQISPIIISDRPIMVESNLGDLSKFFGSLLLLVIGVLAIVGWSVYRTAKRRSWHSGKSELPEKIDTHNLD